MLLAAVPAYSALMLAHPPYRPKDFTIVKKDGQYHVFYIRNDVTKPTLQTERDFGHAVSADMYTWTQLPGVLTVRDTSWDNLHVWAPSIVELDGVYYMFYTGVTERVGAPGVEQRNGLATSTDLMSWNRLDQPIYSCRDVTWAWCDTLNNNNGFRDPFVMRNPAAPGQWLMYYSDYPATDTGGMLVGVASSSGDLTQWDDLMPLWFTNRQYSFSPIIESPHLFKHGNTWFLFLTTNAGQPISFYTTANPTGPDAGWTNRGRLGTMLGLDTRSWYASEYFADGLNDYFAFVNYNRVEIYKMYWTGPQTFWLFEPGDFHVRSLKWNAGSVEKGQNATLTVVATGWVNREVSLSAVEKLPGGGEAPFPIDNIGIPSQIPLTSDTTLFQWPARIFHAAGDTTGDETIVLRASDLTAEAGPITILEPPPPLVVQSLTWNADSIFKGQPVTLSIAALNWSGHTLALEGVEHLAGGGTVPLNLASLGLPAAVPLTAGATPVPWNARIQHASGDTTLALDLELRTADHTVVAPLLRILPPPPAPPPFSIQGLGWSADSVQVGTQVQLKVVATSWAGHAAQLVPIERLTGGAEVSLDADSLGLPGALALTADTTCLVWTARIRRASGDASTALRLVVQNPQFGVETGVLKVSVASPPPPPPFKIDQLRWSSSVASYGESVTLCIIASNWNGHQATLQAAERLAGGADSALTIGDLGLPATVPLTADTTRLKWTSRIRRASGDTTGTQALIVRANGGVESQPLTNVLQQLADGGPEDGTPVDKLPRVRRLVRSVYGALPSFLIDMPGASHVRLDVYDLMGRRVRTVVDRDLPVGASVFAWDGRDASGAAVSRGLYFARFVTPSVARTIKVVLTRPVGSP